MTKDRSKERHNAYMRDYMRKYSAKHRDKIRKQKRETSRRYRAKHREQLLQKRRLQYAADPEPHRERKRAHSATHPYSTFTEAQKVAYRASARAYKKRTYIPRPRILLTKEQLKTNDLVRASRWRAQNLEYKRKADRRYAALHREKAKEKSRAWYANNKKRAAETRKAYVIKNADVIRVAKRNQKARRKKVIGQHTAADIAKIRKLQNNKCVYCKTPLGRNAHLDHITPLSRGGTNWPANLQWLCAPCNLQKNAKDPIAYANELGLLL